MEGARQRGSYKVFAYILKVKFQARGRNSQDIPNMAVWKVYQELKAKNITSQ